MLSSIRGHHLHVIRDPSQSAAKPLRAAPPIPGAAGFDVSSPDDPCQKIDEYLTLPVRKWSHDAVVGSADRGAKTLNDFGTCRRSAEDSRACVPSSTNA
jgi:hypothetical protein